MDASSIDQAPLPDAARPNQIAPNRRDFLVREAVILALVPAIGYGVAYCFALGRARHLGIPDQLISVSLSDVLRSVGAVVAPIGATYLLIAGSANFLPGSWLKKLPEHFQIGLFLFILAIVFLRAAQATWIWWVGVLGGIVGLFVLLYLLALLFFHAINTIRPRAFDDPPKPAPENVV